MEYGTVTVLRWTHHIVEMQIVVCHVKLWKLLSMFNLSPPRYSGSEISGPLDIAKVYNDKYCLPLYNTLTHVL